MKRSNFIVMKFDEQNAAISMFLFKILKNKASQNARFGWYLARYIDADVDVDVDVDIIHEIFAFGIDYDEQEQVKILTKHRHSQQPHTEFTSLWLYF